MRVGVTAQIISSSRTVQTTQKSV